MLCGKSRRTDKTFLKEKGIQQIVEYKSVTFLYTSSEKAEHEIKNTVLFTLTPPKIKYLGVELTKYV